MVRCKGKYTREKKKERKQDEGNVCVWGGGLGGRGRGVRGSMPVTSHHAISPIFPSYAIYLSLILFMWYTFLPEPPSRLNSTHLDGVRLSASVGLRGVSQGRGGLPGGRHLRAGVYQGR